jgi:hypothetical protein
MQRRQGCNSTHVGATRQLHHTPLHYTGAPITQRPSGSQPTDWCWARLVLVLYRCIAVTPGSGHIRRQRYGTDGPSLLHRNSDTRVPRSAVSAYTPAYYCYHSITNITTAVLLLWPVLGGSLTRNIPRRISFPQRRRIPMPRPLGLSTTTRLLLHRPR